MRRPATIGQSRPGRHRAFVWLAWGLGAPVAGAAVLATAIWIFRLTVAEWAVAWLAAANGLGGAEITVEEIGVGRLVARDIRAGQGGSVRLRRFVAEYAAGQLIRGRIGHVVLDGVRIGGRIDGDSLVVAGTEPPLGMAGDVEVLLSEAAGSPARASGRLAVTGSGWRSISMAPWRSPTGG